MSLRFGGIRSHGLAIGAGGRLHWDIFGENACTTAMSHECFLSVKIPKARFLTRTYRIITQRLRANIIVSRKR